MPVKIHSRPDNLNILYEDNHLIAVNKRAGDLIQGDRTGDMPLSDVVKAYIKEKYEKPGAVFLGVVHRLDRPTTGVVIFARTSKALTRLNAMMAKNQVVKTYWAMVSSVPDPPKDTLVHWLVRNSKQNKSYAYAKEVENSKKAELRYKTLRLLDHYALLEIDLKTGRHHQIRAQLAARGMVVKGDMKYGAGRSNRDGGIHLHARNIKLLHPVAKQEISITAPLPEDSLWEAAGE